MKKKFLSTFLAITLSSAISYSALAEPLSDQQQEHKENKIKYQQLNTDIVSLNSKISDLNGQVQKLNNTLQQNNVKIDDMKQQINTVEGQVDNAKNDLKTKQDIFAKRVRAIYKSGSFNDYLAFIINSQDMSDLLTRINAVTRIINVNKSMIDELHSKKQALDNNLNELNSKQQQLEQLKVNTQNDINKLDDKEKELKNDLDKLNEQKEQVASVIKANEEALISHPISVINADNSNVSNLKESITTLKELLPQISSDSVKSKIQSSISKASDKITNLSITAASATVANNNTNGNANTNSNTTSHNPEISRNGNSNKNYKNQISVSATAYSDGLLTATGLNPVRSSSGISTIAVDPNVIPLGSKVYIPGYGYAIASDTGADIQGNRIDLYMNSESECNEWGRRQVTVYVVGSPGEW